MRRTLFALLMTLLVAACASAEPSEPAPLGEADFAVHLPDGTFNLIADMREDLERVTGQVFERFDEFVGHDIIYDRLLTDSANFFADVDAERVNQVSFKEGCLTARGIGLGSTQAEVFEAYGQPPILYEEHGYIRAEYELTIGENRFELFILIYVPDDSVADLLINGYGSGYRMY